MDAALSVEPDHESLRLLGLFVAVIVPAYGWCLCAVEVSPQMRRTLARPPSGAFRIDGDLRLTPGEACDWEHNLREVP